MNWSSCRLKDKGRYLRLNAFPVAAARVDRTRGRFRALVDEVHSPRAYLGSISKHLGVRYNNRHRRTKSYEGRHEQITFDGAVERIAPEVPRFVVYPGRAWDEAGTSMVDVSLNGISIGMRNLVPWKERGWHFGFSEPMCRRVGIDTGDPVHVEMPVLAG